MKQDMGVKLLLVLLICIMFSAMAFSGTDAGTVEELILARTEALNDFYTSKADRPDTEIRLKAVETGGLLQTDTDNLRRYFRTDIDEVEECLIREVKFTQRDEDMLCADVIIDWVSRSLEGQKSFRKLYRVICVKEGTGYKLVQFF